jgi:hypothetical protein
VLSVVRNVKYVRCVSQKDRFEYYIIKPPGLVRKVAVRRQKAQLSKR